MQEAKPNPISHPDGQLETQVALWLLGSLCNLHRRPFDARLVTQAYPPPFITVDGEYRCDTDKVSKSEVTPEIVAITYWISFRGDPVNAPDAETLTCIKDALQENSRGYLFNLEHYKRCQLTLIDVRTGEEI